MTWPRRIYISSMIFYMRKLWFRHTVDPSTVSGGEESNHTCYISRLGATTQGAVVSHELLNLLSGEVGCTTWYVC